MHLSPEAKALLNENKIVELQSLPLHNLITYDQYLNILDLIKNPKVALVKDGGFYSVPRELRDPISLDSLDLPAVVSSGYVYSSSSISKKIASSGRDGVVCPSSQTLLRLDCYGIDGAKQSFVRLPQIDSLVADFKQALKIDRAIDAISFVPATLKLNFRVSRNMLQVQIEPESGSNPEVLRTFLQACFPDKRSEIVVTEEQSRAGVGYCVEGYGRCWQANAHNALIDFWYPQDQLLDEEVNYAIDALLKPLSLPAAEIPPGSIFGSLRTLGIHENKDAFPGMELPQADVAKCCKSFIEFSKKLVTDRYKILNDVVKVSGGAVIPTFTGIMLFGRPMSSAVHSFTGMQSSTGMSTSIGMSSYRR